MNITYYLEVIRNYQELLENDYSDLDALYLLATIFPAETICLLNQGYFQVLDN